MPKSKDSKKDPVVLRYESELSSSQNEIKPIIERIHDHEAELLFAIKFDIIVSKIHEAQENVAIQKRDYAHKPKPMKALRKADEEIESLLDTLRKWKQSTMRPLSHRKRDKSRQPAPRKDYAESCIRRFQRLDHVAQVATNLRRIGDRRERGVHPYDEDY